MRSINISDKGYVLVIRIPRSFNPPHQVTMRGKDIVGQFQFWVRRGADNVRMDVDELRNAFLMSETQAERIRSFRMERLGKILAEDTFLPMQAGAKVVLHLVPQNAFGLGVRYDIKSLTELLYNPRRPQMQCRYNLDGYFAWHDSPTTEYIQVFRNGIVEVVFTRFSGTNRTLPFIGSHELLQGLIEELPRLLIVQQELGVQLPVFLMLSLIGVKEYVLADPTSPSELIRHDAVSIPEEICESFVIDAIKIWKPIFDILWNAAGYDECNYYDAEGNRHDPTEFRLK